MNISMAIVDSDKDYTSRLSEALQQYTDLSISIFTSLQTFQETIARERFDILLFDPDVSEEYLPLSSVKLAVCLYSDECKNTARYTECVKTLKYQRVSNIYRDVLREYANKAGGSFGFDSQQNTKLIGVYSPIGGAGKTTFALAFTGKLKSLGNSVLYASTEQLESASAVNDHSENGMAILIEDLSNENVNFKVKLTAISKRGMDDMEYLEGFTRLVDYEAVTAAEVKEVFERIKKESDYQYIVIDMDSNLDAVNRTIFEMADQIVLVERPGELPMRKMELFSQQILVHEQERKLYKIQNFAESNSVYSDEPDVPVIGKVHHYGNLKLANIIRAMNSNGEYDISQFIH